MMAVVAAGVVAAVAVVMTMIRCKPHATFLIENVIRKPVTRCKVWAKYPTAHLDGQDFIDMGYEWFRPHVATLRWELTCC